MKTNRNNFKKREKNYRSSTEKTMKADFPLLIIYLRICRPLTKKDLTPKKDIRLNMLFKTNTTKEMLKMTINMSKLLKIESTTEGYKSTKQNNSIL